MMQFSDIYLSRREKALLDRLFTEKQTLTGKEIEVFDYLNNLGFAESSFVAQYDGSKSAHDDEYTITDLGRRYLLWFRAQRRRLIGDWIRYGVTTVIAMSALITSIVSIAMQRA